VRLLSKSWGEDLSVDDIPLIDELRYLLGDPPLVNDEDEDPLGLADTSLTELTTASEREYSSGRTWSPPTNRVEDDGYAHVLIDEAQDLSPMQWRMVGRRGGQASWTIVGDAAQSAWPDLGEALRARTDALRGKQIRRFHLSTNYRNSAEIFEFAATVVRRAVPDADLPDAVRRTGASPSHQVVPATAFPEATVATVEELLGAVQGRRRGRAGRAPRRRTGVVRRRACAGRGRHARQGHGV
jgi:hypothetical protein